MIECVIYDCDGVLFDSLDANKRLYNHICVSMGRASITEKELEFCHTHTVHQSIHCLFPDDSELEARASTFLKSEISFKDYVPFLKMEDHLLETLSMLRQQGIKTAISTNRTSSMPHVMETYHLRPYFDMVVTALDVVQPKPHRESVDKIVETLRVNRKNVLYIGDSDVDLGTAQSSGVTFVSYKNPAISQGILIEDHRDIFAVVRQCGETPSA